MTPQRSRRILPAIFFAALLGAQAMHVLAADQPPAARAAARHGLVIQVSDNDPGKWNLALNNARNVQQDLGADKVDVEIVAYGPGLNMLKLDSVAGNKLADALDAGVKVVACENTMRNTKTTRADILPRVGFVSAGVVELMQRQQEGWAYVRP